MRQPRFESHGTSSAAPANGQSEIEVRAKIATKLYSSKHVMECILTQYPHDNMVLARAVEIVGENEIVGLERSMPDTHTELVKLALRINVTLSSNTAAVTSSAAQLRPSALVSTAHTPIKNPHLKVVPVSYTGQKIATTRPKSRGDEATQGPLSPQRGPVPTFTKRRDWCQSVVATARSW
jgi:hypothetical protein